MAQTSPIAFPGCMGGVHCSQDLNPAVGQISVLAPSRAVPWAGLARGHPSNDSIHPEGLASPLLPHDAPPASIPPCLHHLPLQFPVLSSPHPFPLLLGSRRGLPPTSLLSCRLRALLWRDLLSRNGEPEMERALCGKPPRPAALVDFFGIAIFI